MNFKLPNRQFLGRKGIGNENGRNSKTVMPHTTMFDCERGEVKSKCTQSAGNVALLVVWGTDPKCFEL